MPNSLAHGFSLHRSLEDQGVTTEEATRAHINQAQELYECRKLKSFTDYRVPNRQEPNLLR